ncbi:MAG TPA: hypothetical protein VLX92_23210 [Kofleriaceae bacterium]|nr:hypothetical protein [Kofleriaceae bacterium]
MRSSLVVIVLLLAGIAHADPAVTVATAAPDGADPAAPQIAAAPAAPQIAAAPAAAPRPTFLIGVGGGAASIGIGGPVIELGHALGASNLWLHALVGDVGGVAYGRAGLEDRLGTDAFAVTLGGDLGALGGWPVLSPHLGFDIRLGALHLRPEIEADVSVIGPTAVGGVVTLAWER